MGNTDGLGITLDQMTFVNNEYHKYIAVGNESNLNQLNIEIIYPITDIHISKYSYKDLYLIHESNYIYNTYTKVMIDNINISSIQWLYDILNGIKEYECRIGLYYIDNNI